MQVTLKKYAKLSPKAFTGPLVGRKRIAVIQASGAITGAEAGGPTSSGINASQVPFPPLFSVSKTCSLKLVLNQSDAEQHRLCVAWIDNQAHDYQSNL